MLANRYGPAFEGDTEFTWCLCFGCGLPFQYWGMFGVQMEDPEDADETIEREIVGNIGCGPCTWCGGVGKPVTGWAIQEKDGIRSYASNARMFNVFDEVRARLETGEITVSDVVDQLRAEQSPLPKRVSDWLESRPSTTVAVVGLLTILATMFGPYLAPDDDHPVPQPGIHEQQLEEILEKVLEHYDAINPPGAPPPRSRVPSRNHSNRNP